MCCTNVSIALWPVIIVFWVTLMLWQRMLLAICRAEACLMTSNCSPILTLIYLVGLLLENAAPTARKQWHLDWCTLQGAQATCGSAQWSAKASANAWTLWEAFCATMGTIPALHLLAQDPSLLFLSSMPNTTLVPSHRPVRACTEEDTL